MTDGPFRTVVVIVLDSLRQDSFDLAETPNIDRLLPDQQERHSYATWTLPSHGCLLAGLLPFPKHHGQSAARVYNDDMRMWSATFNGNHEGSEHFAPHFSLAEVARENGYATYASMAMPILNQYSTFTRGFDIYEDSAAVTSLRFAAQVESAIFNLNPTQPNFVFINSGDTHYPYLLPPAEMPRISGLHGAVKANGVAPVAGFNSAMYRTMHDSQVRAAEQVDRVLGDFIAELPKPARVFVLSDHGELFGEDGLFGHGPFAHRLLLDVPFATGDILR